MKRKLKMTGIILAIGVGVVLIGGVLYVNLNPHFGQGLSKSQVSEFESLPNFNKGKFQNRSTIEMDMNFGKTLREYLKKAPNRKPVKDLEVVKIDSATLAGRKPEKPLLTWFGHSAFLLEMDGKKILIDPMLGNKPAPYPMPGPSRYSNDLPISPEQLPFIDAVIFSHDHYDHLDYGTIQKIKDKVGHFFTPLGVDNHLISWGVDPEKITTLNWWESTRWESFKLTSAPARHFSGRGLFDRETTLWCSWIIEGREHKIFFSGDSGYDDHFKEIGEKFGPFDFAMMECGQYNESWKYLHMMPEETVLAGRDVKAEVVMPVHWGAFTLALHDWTDPVERAVKKATELNMPIATPRIGETMVIGGSDYPNEDWWSGYTVTVR